MASYTVQSGDTLSGIGAKNGVDWHSISGYKSGNPNLIYPGEVLSWGSPDPAPAAAAPAPVAPAPAPAQQDTVSPLFNDLTNFDNTSKNPIDIYNAALDKLGISDARTRVTSLRQSLIDNQNLLDNLGGNVSARTADSLVTENQRQRLVAQEAAPITNMGNQLNQQFTAAQGDYQGILGEAKTSTGIETDAQAARRSALMDRLKIQIDQTNDAEKKREWQAEYDRQAALDKENQANKDRDYALAQQQAAKGSSGGGGGSSGGGGGSSASDDWTTMFNDIKQTPGANGMASVGADGYANPTAYKAVRANYVSQGGSASAFDSHFASLRNPDQKNHPSWEQY